MTHIVFYSIFKTVLSADPTFWFWGDYKYRPRSKHWNYTPSQYNLVTGCLVPFIITIIIIGTIYLLATYFGWE
jgi:hypothetical protein